MHVALPLIAFLADRNSSVHLHRRFYELQTRPTPPPLELSHLCGNGHLSCISTLHLCLETHRQNRVKAMHHAAGICAHEEHESGEPLCICDGQIEDDEAQTC